MAQRRLTARQQAFVDAYLAGKSPSESYRCSYECGGMTAATIATEAQRVLSNPNVAPIVSESKRDAIKRASWNRELAIERMKSINDRAYDELIGGDLSRDSQRAFFDSELRLSQLCDFDFESEMRRRGVKHAIENRSPLAIMHGMEWAEIKAIIDEADKEASSGTQDFSTDNA